ncbi:ABC transporter substrate-binding protein [Alicyclobacillus fodiniaquatilis]|uniref:ABC transporter substrate-binding protein n=1 Tax=Alicyclobacillus fodiniaquatilis TaxID=1661150 RepID=A0ABW4JIX5_9BACL
MKSPKMSVYACSFVAMGAIVGLSACGTSSSGNSSKQSSNVTSSKTVTSNSGAKTTLTVLTWGNDATTNYLSQTLKTLNPKLAKQYTFKPILAANDDTVSKYKLELSSGQTVPDIIQINATDLPAMWNTKTITNLTSTIKPYESDMFTATKLLVSFKGQDWGFPYQIKTKLWYYRTDMFKNAGINVNNVHTLGQFIQAGKKLQKKYPNSYIWNLGDPVASYDLGMILTGNGGEFTNSTGKFVINTNPGVKNAFVALKQLYDSGVVADTPDFTAAWTKDLAKGTIASTLSASWLEDMLPSYAPKLAGNWGVAQWPVIAGSVGGSEAGGSVFVIPQNAPDKAAAIKVLSQMLLTKTGNIAFYKAMGQSTFVKSAQSAVEKTPNAYYGANFAKQYNMSLKSFKEMQYDPRYTNELTIVNQYLQLYLSGKDTLQQALNGAQTTASAQIQNPWTQ